MQNKVTGIIVGICLFALVVLFVVSLNPQPVDASQLPPYGMFKTSIYPYSPITYTTADTELLPAPPTSTAWVIDWIAWEVTAKDDAATAIIEDGYTTAVTVDYIPLDTESGPHQRFYGDKRCTMDQGVHLNFNSSDSGILAVTIAAHPERAGG